MTPLKAYSAFTFRVGILGLNTTRGFAGASPPAPADFCPDSDVLRIDAPIAIGAEVTVAAGRVVEAAVLGPASACSCAPSSAFWTGAGASVGSVAVDSGGAELSTSWDG